MCNNKDFFERQQVEMLLSAELAKPYPVSYTHLTLPTTERV